MTRSKDKEVRALADDVFCEMLLGNIKTKNPLFQEALEERIDRLLAAKAARGELAVLTTSEQARRAAERDS